MKIIFFSRNHFDIFNISSCIMVFPPNFTTSLPNCMEFGYYSKISYNYVVPVFFDANDSVCRVIPLSFGLGFVGV